MSDDTIPAHLVRVLEYVDLVDAAGGHLTSSDLEAFAQASVPEPEGMAYAQPLGLQAIFQVARASTLATVSYLQQVNWITDVRGGVTLTELGRAVLNAGRARAAPLDTSQGLVLSPDDPLRLSALTGLVGSLGEATLVEPYLQDQVLEWVFSCTQISKIIICRNQDKIVETALALGKLNSDKRSVEVRYFPPRELHDRYVVPKNDTPYMLGASLNGLDKHFTTMVPMPNHLASAIRTQVDAWWRDGKPIEPRAGLVSA